MGGLLIELTSSTGPAPVPTGLSVAYSLKACQEFVLTFLLGLTCDDDQ